MTIVGLYGRSSNFVNNFFIVLVCNRNRTLEKTEYGLDIDDRTQTVRIYEADQREIWVMRKTGQVELSPSYIRGIQELQGGHKLLVCEGFDIRTSFPNNVVLLTDDRVLYCTDFTEHESATEPGMSRFGLSGFFFKTVKPAWDDHPCSSARIGFFKVSQIELSEVVTVSGMDLVGKCFVSVRGDDPDKKPVKNPVPGSFDVMYRQFLKTSERFKEKKTNEAREMVEQIGQQLLLEAHQMKVSDPSYLYAYWWVHCINIPGRFPNIFQ